MSAMSRLLISLFLLLVIACGDSPTVPICTDEVRNGIVLRVYDANTGEDISCEVNAVVSDGEYRETLDASLCDAQTNDGAYGLYGLAERAGSYALVISADAYQDYSEQGIVIEEDQCHVITQLVEVDLVPLP